MKAYPFLLRWFAPALLTGCIATKYQSADATVSATTTLDLRATNSPLEICLDAVIVRDSPGSWKRSALWDEYAFAFANRGNATWRITGISAVGPEGRPVTSGHDPWDLERNTLDWWNNVGVEVAIGLEFGAGSALAGVTMGLATAGASLVAGPLLGDVVALNILAYGVGVAAVPAALAAHGKAKLESKEKIAAEFHHRRTGLLVALPPGRETRGSAFFPVTPGPQRLLIEGRSGAETRTADVELPFLAGLHRKSAPPPPSVVSAELAAFPAVARR